ncbi:cytochrome P450 [Exidia glandulosa HHB12029]|uniref:Cytochrome P450 n=1 Tax=Exidia glandulosa HHB12029 TaxID=1314781 RepID=A0A165DYX3_EXIGL|nr:cytochrome P450 [Exidia glandulosa HHB12029]
MLYFIGFGVAVVAPLLWLSQDKQQRPPGPRRFPLLGNVLDISVDDIWLLFSRWGKEYGSLVYIKIFNQPTLIINSHHIAVDLMTRRARVYSDRPWNYVAKELLLGGHFMPFMDYNDRCRRLRRAAQEGFRKATLPRYRKIQQAEATRAASELLQHSANWVEHLSTTAASTIMSSVYGFPPTDDKNPDVQAIKQHTERIARAIFPGTYLVDTFPWLRHLPAWLCSWHRDTHGFYAKDNAVVQRLFHSSETGPAVTFSRAVAEKVDEGLLDDGDAAWLCATLLQTSAALCWFITSMVIHQDVQARAHDELDRVVGRNRLPSFDDKDNLPYLNAIVHEVLRWRPPLPIGVPHCLAVNDVYQGFHVARGTVCIPNIWGMNRDPDVWGTDAEMFRPERQLDEHGNLRSRILNTHDESHTSFGFGNRVCPGKHFAGDTMFITCATILWACKMSASRNVHGDLELPSEYAHTGTPMTLHPTPFPCEFSARFSDALSQVSTERNTE